ncbi:hypothetical protein CRYUN_Cryun01aG0004500 [Craigia yunnanensis]
MKEKDLVAWGSMISGFCQNRKFREALGYFGRMNADGIRPDSDIMSSVIIACIGLENVDSGCMIHGYVIKSGLDRDVYVATSLVDMYSKCGFPDMAENVFSEMPHKNLVAWNSMMSCYCRNGLPDQSIKLFSKIVQHGFYLTNGFYPNSISMDILVYISEHVSERCSFPDLSCNYAGLVDEGHNIFHSMTVEHGIEPKMEHNIFQSCNYADLLGRAGPLEDAYNFVKTMHMEPDRSVWLSLLCASRARSNVELGELAAHNLLKVELDRSSNYVQLLLLYGEAALWDKAANIRSTMKEKGLKKNPGCSWIELRDKVDVFFSGDSSSLRTMEIYMRYYIA